MPSCAVVAIEACPAQHSQCDALGTYATCCGAGTMNSGNSKQGSVPVAKMSKAVSQVTTINYLRGSRLSTSEGDLSPADYTTEVFERAETDLRGDVMDMIRVAFEAFAVDPPAVPEVKAELSRTGTQRSPKVASAAPPKRERGVPFEDIPLFLDALGCYTHPDMVRTWYGTVDRARGSGAVLWGRGAAAPIRVEYLF